MAETIIESRTIDDKYLATLPYRDLQYEVMLNKAGGARFTIPMSLAKDLTTTEIEEGRTEISVVRNGVSVYRGPLWELTVDSSDQTIKVSSGSLASYLEVRQLETDTTYSDSYGNMAWNFINNTQLLGSFGITRGTTTGTGSPATTVSFKDGDYIDEVHKKLADCVDGFDWEITPDRVYNQYYPRIKTRANVSLDFPGNIKTYSISRQGKYARNKVRTIGANSTMSDFALDSNSIAKFGVRHYSESQTDINTMTLLNAYNGQVLEARANPKHIPTISADSRYVNPLDGDIKLGQITKVSIDDGFTQYSSDMRIVGYQVTIGKHGNESIMLYMNDLREVN